MVEGSTPAPAEVVEAIIQAYFAVRRQFDGRADGSAVSMPQSRLLTTVARAGCPVRMSDLARRLGTSNRTITPLVDALEREGLLCRRPDARDRRAILVEPTETGLARSELVCAAQQAVSAHAVRHLTDEERMQLVDLLRRLVGQPEAGAAGVCCAE